MAKKGNQISVGKDFEGNLIQGDGNSIVKNDINSEELGQSLGEVLSDLSRSARWEEYHRQSNRRESREILEPMFVSGVSGLSLGTIWNLVTPWETIVVFPIALLVGLAFSIFHITQLGVRQNLTLSMLVSLLFALLLKFTTIENWMPINAFVGTLIFGMTGIFIGLISGIAMLFWKPFGK